VTDLPPILQDVVNALTICGPRAKVADLRGKLLYTTADVGVVRERLHELRQLDRVAVEHHGGESYWSLLGQMVKGNTPPPKRKYQRRTPAALAPQAHEAESTDVPEQPRIDDTEREKRERKEQREREFQAIRAAADRATANEVELRKSLLDRLPTFSDGWDPSVQGAWFSTFQKLMDPL